VKGATTNLLRALGTILYHHYSCSEGVLRSLRSLKISCLDFLDNSGFFFFSLTRKFAVQIAAAEKAAAEEKVAVLLAAAEEKAAAEKAAVQIAAAEKAAKAAVQIAAAEKAAAEEKAVLLAAADGI
jgi:hypothetical protein